MNLRAKYDTESLYPFQDGVLKLVQKSGAPFYLSGGTALNRKNRTVDARNAAVGLAVYTIIQND